MKFKRGKAAAAGAALALGAVIAVTANAVPAYATQNQICGNGGSGYCLNDWNGGGYGNAVKMYYGNSSNENFLALTVAACSGTDIVSSTCPFANRTLDSLYKGDEIRELEYMPNGLCVATNSSGGAILATCANRSTGSGGSNGVIMIAHHGGGSCDFGVQWYFVNRYWSDYYGTTETLASGGNIGVQAYLNYRGLGTCWGAIGSPLPTPGFHQG